MRNLKFLSGSCFSESVSSCRIENTNVDNENKTKKYLPTMLRPRPPAIGFSMLTVKLSNESAKK